MRPTSSAAARSGPSSSDLTRAAGALVVLMVVAVAVLVVAFWRSAAASRARAWTAAEQMAHGLNQSFQVEARNRVAASITRLFSAGSDILSGPPGPALAAMAEARYDAPPGCGCSRIQPRYAFLLELPSARAVVVGDTTALPVTGRIASAGRAAAAVDPDSSLTYGTTGTDARGPWIIYYRTFPLADGHRVAYGFELAAEILDTAFLRPAARQVQRERWRDAVWADSVFAVEVTLLDSVVSGPPRRYDGGPSAARRYRGGFEFLRTTLTLNPAGVQHLLPGGIPEVPRAALLTLLVLDALLGAVTLFLLSRARALVALREEFASAVSHELRTPLTQILLFAEMLTLDRGDPESRRRAGDVIVRETRRLIHLVENVLAFARGRRPGVRLAPAVHDLAVLTNAVIQDAVTLAQKFEATLHADLAPGIAAEVDPDAWRQIVLNLVDNALRYGPGGQQVRISLTTDGDRAVLQVDDQGPGVVPDDRERIWRPYVRLGTDRERRAGTGIGLAIVAQLAGLLGGSVTVEDAPGGGARFIVRLPVIAALAEPPALDDHREAGSWPPS